MIREKPYQTLNLNHKKCRIDLSQAGLAFLRSNDCNKSLKLSDDNLEGENRISCTDNTTNIE